MIITVRIPPLQLSQLLLPEFTFCWQYSSHRCFSYLLVMHTTWLFISAYISLSVPSGNAGINFLYKLIVSSAAFTVFKCCRIVVVAISCHLLATEDSKKTEVKDSSSYGEVEMACSSRRVVRGDYNYVRCLATNQALLIVDSANRFGSNPLPHLVLLYDKQVWNSVRLAKDVFWSDFLAHLTIILLVLGLHCLLLHCLLFFWRNGGGLTADVQWVSVWSDWATKILSN